MTSFAGTQLSRAFIALFRTCKAFSFMNDGGFVKILMTDLYKFSIPREGRGWQPLYEVQNISTNQYFCRARLLTHKETRRESVLPSDVVYFLL